MCIHTYIYIYIYIYAHIWINIYIYIYILIYIDRSGLQVSDPAASRSTGSLPLPPLPKIEDRRSKIDPHRAQISQFELFKLILLFKLDKQLPAFARPERLPEGGAAHSVCPEL